MRLLDETPVVLLLQKLCLKHGYSIEWKITETPQLANNWKSITQLRTSRCTKTAIYSSGTLSSTSRTKDLSSYFRKLGSLSDPVSTRSDKHACGEPMLTDHDKATGNREPAYKKIQTRCTRRIQRKVFLTGYSPSRLISRNRCDTTMEAQCSHSFLQIPKEIYSTNRRIETR